MVGTGPDLNSATDNGLQRAVDLLDMPVAEVKNRATITGAIEIGRHPGVVQVTFRAPVERLERKGLLTYAREIRLASSPNRRRGPLRGRSRCSASAVIRHLGLGNWAEFMTATLRERVLGPQAACTTYGEGDSEGR